MGQPVTCSDTVILEDDDVGRNTVLRAIREHVYRCSGGICYTSHGTFTMVDGILFESVIW